MQQVAARYTPRFYLHPDEKVMPCSIEDYMFSSSLCTPETGVSVPVVQKMTMNDIALANSTPEASLFCHLDQLPKKPLQDVPVYCRVHAVPEHKEIRLAYFYFFPTNPDLNLCCLPPSCNAGPCKGGYHNADLEHCSVYLDADTLRPKSVYLATHGRQTGQWLVWDEVQKTEDGRPVVFLACNSHATYPTDGTWWRLCCVFANDHTAKGPEWNPPVILVTESEPVYMQYKGYAGYPDAVHFPPSHYSWDSDSPIQGILWRRLFDCLL